MEPRRNLSILPSNAPALPLDTSDHPSTPHDFADATISGICQIFNQGFGCQVCNLDHICLLCKQDDHGAIECKSAVLQVRSDNIGLHTSESRNTDSKFAFHRGHEVRTSSFRINAPDHSAQAALHAERAKGQRRNLASRMRPYYWHTEWQTPRYRQYREKTRQKVSKYDSIWPDRVEEAFQIALRLYRRRGRKKEVLNGKQSGGNEFISDFILKTTGVYRDRKQVSSHIQVLKSFLHDNREWMSLVPDINPEKRSKKTLGHGCYRDTEREMESGGFDDTADYQFDQEVYRGCTNDLASPAAEIRGCSVYKGPTIRWVDFAMTLSAPLPGTNGKSRPDRRILHTYTSIQCNTASAPKPLEEIRDWRLFYPPLATYYDQEQMECPMFLFDTTLSLMDDFPMVPGRRPSLSIDLSVHFTEGTNFDDWQSSPSFYENGKPVDLAKYYRESEKCQESDLSRESGAYNNLWSNLKCSQIEGTADLKLNEISLKSAWWVDVFYNMVRKNYEVRESGDPQAIKQEEEHAHRYLQELSVMHEIRATPRAYPARPQRMAVLLWKFGKSKKGETATTSWRRLTPPLSPFQIQSPSPSLSQPPMTLDMALDGAQVRRSAPSYAEYYNLEPSIFSNNPQHLPTTPSLSEEGSSSTTPTADSRSLLSSTSTSFPSSISNSAYAPTNNVLLLPIHNSSQESSSHSQHSVYHSSLESFDSQQSELYQYQNSDIVAHSQSYERHGFSTNSQDTIGSSDIYHSQDAAYHQAEIPLYEYPVPHPDTLATASPSDDFTGGEIQLSFAHAPLMVPRANFVPQHQLIQRPEDFDHEYLDQSHHDGRGPDRQRQQHMHEHSAEQPLLRPYELNGYTIDYDGWEETLQLHPEMERHLGHIVEGDLGQVGDHYNTPERRQQHEEVEGEVSILRQVDVLGEDQDDDTPPERRLEYQ